MHDVLQGNCSTQPDESDFPDLKGVDLVPTSNGQCLLLSHEDLLSVISGKFWADNLYLRTTKPPDVDRAFHFPALAIVPPLSTGTKATYWTNMIFQGDGSGSTVGMGIAADTKVFVQGKLPESRYACYPASLDVSVML